MPVILHLGSQKTGSTSIQKLMNAATGELAVAGVHRLRPKELGAMRLAHGFTSGAPAIEGFAELVEEFVAAARRHPDQTWVVSNEMLFAPGVAQNLRRLVTDPIGAPVRVIVYLRRPDDYIEALYKQRVKNGRVRPGAWAFFERNPEAVDYAATLEDFAAVFGDSAIEVVPYDRKLFPGGDVVADFMGRIGAPMPQADAAEGSRNATLSLPMSELIGATTEWFPPRTILRLVQQAEAAAGNTPRKHDTFTLDQRRAIMAAAAPSIAEVERRWYADRGPMFDMAAFAADAPDPYPTAEERADDWRAAARAVVATLSQAAVGRGEDDLPARGKRRERKQRRRPEGEAGSVESGSVQAATPADAGPATRSEDDGPARDRRRARKLRRGPEAEAATAVDAAAQPTRPRARRRTSAAAEADEA